MLTNLRCKSCGTENRVGELICSHCGDLLTLSQPSSTAKLRLESFAAGVLVQEPHVLQMTVGSKTREIGLINGCAIVVGRGVSALRDEAVLDLVEFRAVEQGVSREHAMIHMEGASVFLTDLESTNGTYLNGRLLHPHQPNVLRGGDTVHFGRLEVRITLA